MSESSSSSEPPKKKVGVSPRTLPERQGEVGVPFEQLNEATPPEEAAPVGRGIVQPRSLPSKDKAVILEAARLLQEGKTHEEVSRQLKIEPLKLRRWERAYSAEFQRDLNEGEYHDTDAQLRELSEDSKEKFQGNWEQVTEKATERRVKVGPLRSKLLAHPATRWIFRNEHGSLDYGTLLGVFVALIGLGVALRYMSAANEQPIVTDDETQLLMGFDEITSVEHNEEAAIETVINFLRTPTWEDKLQYVSHPEKVRPLMEEWYAKHPEDVTFERITFAMDQPIEVGSRNFIQIGLLVGQDDGSRADDRNAIIAVEQMDDGSYKVDWETSSGYQPMSFEELTTKRPTEPVELRLTLEPADFYNYSFKKEDYFVFKGTYLGKPEALYLYGRRDHPQVRQLNHSLALVESIGAILKVRYPEDAKVAHQLEITEVVAENWFRDYEDE